MFQLVHLGQNKKKLDFKFAILKLVREFFWAENFTEVESPTIVKFPGQEPNLSPMNVTVHNENREAFGGYLHTSPEYSMKKMLAAGWDKIFYLGKCFRDQESFGGMHNPEFTMLEWYRKDQDMFKLMDDIESLFNYIKQKMEITNFKFQKITMSELWNEYVGANLDEYLETEKMFELCESFGYKPEITESYEELFYRIFLNKVEPELAKMGAVFVYNYPVQMAALSKVSDSDNNYAERFELYVDGIELANAFSELTDSVEQQNRLEKEKTERLQNRKDVYEIDLEFIESLKFIPKSAGCALGVDRLVMALGGLQNIDKVITLPASKLF